MMDRREQIDGFFFEQKDLGNGLVEIRIRTDGSKENCKPAVTGNTARKRWLRYILASATALLDTDEEGAETLYERAQQLCAQCDREYELLSSGLRERAH